MNKQLLQITDKITASQKKIEILETLMCESKDEKIAGLSVFLSEINFELKNSLQKIQAL